MIPVKIKKISYYHPSRSYAVILEEINGNRSLPVLVGAYEAQSIAMAMEFVETPRPLTHDLIVNLIKKIDGKLSAVKITKIEDGVYFSSIDIQSKILGHRYIDSRPSDALAIALRMHTPILVAKEVMDEAIVWEEDSLIIEDEIKQSPELETLEEQLQKAIEKEEYEIAARIRDKIKDFDS
ncbi:MAG: bifunctional nuclease family protein [Candidatus Neomarinimicrobiota bacterium]|nr:bifunctional nuclease family protein [Candidatus Neomarinimicrobiota bacterium]